MKLKWKLIIVSGIVLILAVATTTIIFGGDQDDHPLFTEPSVKPSGLPPSAKFNPYTNEYYDSESYRWDKDTKSYIYLNPSPVDNNTSQLPTIGRNDWVKQHQNSQNEVEQALIKYSDAMDEYLNNHPELTMSFSSDWQVGKDGGPLNILINLGTKNLQNMLNEIDWQNPFSVPLEIAVCEITKSKSSNIYTDEIGIANWKAEVKNKISNANSFVNKLVSKLSDNQPLNDSDIEQLDAYGAFALPEFYNEIINNSNTKLIKYASHILPESKIKEFNIQKDVQDDVLLKKALQSCQEDAKTISSLTIK